jgi:GNAT superfamily N-acetyltransferase
MITVESFQAEHLPQLQALVNAHIGALVPGWALPAAYLAERLARNPGEYIVDPWVIERATLCAIEQRRVVAAAHLLRYGSGPEVGARLRNVGEIAWLFGWPDAAEAIAATLLAAHQQLKHWKVAGGWALESPPIGPFAGLPDAWPHIATALARVGYRAGQGTRQESIYGGWLPQVPPPGEPPIEGITLQRTAGGFGTCFTALLSGQAIGACECIADLGEGGALPALRGWGELTKLEVHPDWRSRGIGSWLVQHAVAWLRLGGCDRVVLSVAAENEAAGAGRFYQRLGWQPLVRLQRGLSLPPEADPLPTAGN